MTDARTTAPDGERRTSELTKDAIRRAGARLFAEQGFGTTSVREIARAAGADPALVIRYFGSKERLFLETMTVGTVFRSAAEAPLDRLAEALLRDLIGGAPETRRIYIALMRAVDSPEVRDYLIRASAANIVDPLVERLPGADARLRAALVAAQLNGLLSSLWILEDPELSALDLDTIVATYAPALQVLLDGHG